MLPLIIKPTGHLHDGKTVAFDTRDLWLKSQPNRQGQRREEWVDKKRQRGGEMRRQDKISIDKIKQGQTSKNKDRQDKTSIDNIKQVQTR